MQDYKATLPSSPDREPGEQPSKGDPARQPDTVPWHDPGPPVRKVNLPPDSPSPGVPVTTPDKPERS
jgi:hypothetical protein